ncbi:MULTISPECIES: F0F1 ATP synthase subunit delta [Streptococcus]|uniref:ATP synthase subunit delta n=2 Tax=Streptococcus iners TaxID=3028084 RepID=A0AA96VSI1_9STRE|nr:MULTISPECIES: F0F1 ATP synthase subunit delta [Streptococcus]MCK3942859.1 F0F1 ATP synthase subunit delta [Streptococcus suis]MCK4024691.1 F0F1 ATP synthase subunit delta [Streptococcus suis]MCK4029766.1 F0F1 ATP synthase subunit delta [Streptococcus suis]NQJ70177.1 F0F1 ATP synthase subunit delta [Streptococcus suis]NQN86898.1 F0F1 ATP synthase subunit delta [Streptococcus suis]
MNARENALVQKYALSFVEKVSDHAEIWEMYDQLSELITIIHDSKLNRLLLSATVSREEKAAFVRTVRQSSFWQINDLIEDIIRDGHADLLLETLERVRLQISKFKNEFEAHVVSVYPLTEVQKDRLRQLVEERFSLRVRTIIEELDQSLLGGFIVSVNHKVIDASVRTQLKDVRKKL